MTQTLELSDNDFKGTTKIILSEVKENTSRMSEKEISGEKKEI